MRSVAKDGAWVFPVFRGDPLRARVREILKPHPTEEQHEAVCDFAVMFPVSPPAFVAGDSDAYDLARVAKMDAAPRKSLFGVFGYPRSYEDRNIVDYAAGTVTFGLHLAIGTHEGPSSIKGHHTLDVSTAEIGGPNGFSGGPVFRLLFDKASGAWTPAFAGIVTMGGPKRIQHDLHGSLRHPVTFPLGRVGRPDDAAIAVSFLASDQSSFGPGQLHLRDRAVVDGGLAQV